MKGKEAEYVINLGRIYSTRRTGRAPRAVRYVRDWVARKTHAEEVLIDESVNKEIWRQGIEKPPRRIEVKIIVEETREVKTKKGETLTLPKKVIVYLKGHEPKEEKEEKKKKE